MKANKMKLVIDRSKWLRGEGHEKSYLLREPDGKMCCLGFFGLACGLPAERITNIESPAMLPTNDDETAASVWKNTNEASDFLFNDDDDSHICSKLMTANDDEETTSEDREEEITKLFSMGGVEVQFIGE